jgi:uncharacterized membrane protein
VQPVQLCSFYLCPSEVVADVQVKDERRPMSPVAAVAGAVRNMYVLTADSFHGFASPAASLSALPAAAAETVQKNVEPVLSTVGHGIGGLLYVMMMCCVLAIGFIALFVDILCFGSEGGQAEERKQRSTALSEGPEEVFDDKTPR